MHKKCMVGLLAVAVVVPTQAAGAPNYSLVGGVSILSVCLGIWVGKKVHNSAASDTPEMRRERAKNLIKAENERLERESKKTFTDRLQEAALSLSDRLTPEQQQEKARREQNAQTQRNAALAKAAVEQTMSDDLLKERIESEAKSAGWAAGFMVTAAGIVVSILAGKW